MKKFNDNFYNIFIPEKEAIKIYKKAFETGIPYNIDYPEGAII